MIVHNVLYECLPNHEIVTVPDGVTGISYLALSNNTSMKIINIPDSVTDIGIGFITFCPLTAINVASGNPAYCSVDGVLFNKMQTELLKYPCKKSDISYSIPNTVTKIGHYAFQNATSLQQILLPNGLTDIGSNAFTSCSNLTRIVLPKGVTRIEQNTFGNCNNLKQITIPLSLTEIGAYAFDSCNKLTDVFYTGTTNQWSQIAIEKHNQILTIADIHCIDNQNILFLPEDVTTIESEAFTGLPDVVAIWLPAHIAAIAADAFDAGIMLYVPDETWEQWAEDHGYESVMQ